MIYRIKHSILCVLFLSSFIIARDLITIRNKTPIDLSAAIYYLKGESSQASEVFLLPAGESTSVERPKRKPDYDREVYFSVNNSALTESLSRGQSQFIPHFNIGATKGSEFYVVFDKGSFKGLNRIEYKIIEPILNLIGNIVQKVSAPMFSALKSQYGSYPHQKETAVVRTGKPGGPQENSFMALRRTKVKSALEKLLNIKLADNQVIRIGLCASGGGYRAMTAFLGSFAGLRQAGLLDVTSYMAGLSGGAWGVTVATMSDDPIEYCIKRVNKNITSDIAINPFMSALWEKFIFDVPLSIIDLYGLFLANRLLGGLSKKPFDLVLTDQQKIIAQAKLPLPIYSAIVTKQPYEWVEFTPYEVGSSYLGGFIPTWAFNSPFNKGSSLAIIPESSLAFYLGICGSAFSANIEEAYNEIRKNIHSSLILSALDAGTSQEIIKGTRILPAKVWNFTFGMPSSPRWQQKYLTLIDAGLDFNVPTPPLLDRGSDIIIIFDNSMTIQNAPALVAAKAYADRNQLPFPAIDVSQINNNPGCTIFWDKAQPKAPVIIYMPLVKDPEYGAFDPIDCIANSFCTTANFVYKKDQVYQLSGLTQFLVRKNAGLITDTIREVIKLKSP